GTCAVTATDGAWATQTCQIAETSGLGRLFVSFGGAARLNWLKFQPIEGGGTTDGGAGGMVVLTGTGVTSGTAGTSGGTAGTSGGATGTSGGASSGCGCGIGDGGWPSGALAVAGVVAALLRARRR